MHTILKVIIDKYWNDSVENLKCKFYNKFKGRQATYYMKLVQNVNNYKSKNIYVNWIDI